MTRRRWLQVILAIALVGILTLSGFWANQVMSESRAHGSLDRARASAVRQMRHAAFIGVLPSEMAPLRRSMHALDTARAPRATPLVGTEVTHFYERQTAAYRNLALRTRLLEAAVTRRTARQATAALSQLAAVIKIGVALGLDVAQASQTLSREGAVLKADKNRPTPGRFRDVIAGIEPAVSAQRTVNNARRQVIDSLVAKAGGDLTTLQSAASSQVAALNTQLALLQDIDGTTGQADNAAVSRLLGAVRSATTVQAAAVQDALLQDELARVRGDFDRKVPAKVIVVSTEKQWVWMYQNGQVVDNSPVTTGGPELPTYHGVFHIYMKVTPWVFHSPFPVTSPYYYIPTPITYWMPFDGQQGLHDAWWRSNFGPGSNYEPTNLGTGSYILGTHGCVNLPMAAAQFIWNWAPTGTTVVVI